MSLRFGGIEFKHVSYDQEGDVLYLRNGTSTDAVDWDESPEGHHLRYGADGQLVGITIVNARWLLEQEGRITVTLPQMQVEASDLEGVLMPA
ncbi:MAG: hypothetical protein HW413_3045 [Thermoleophilia bacterium]|nr:hypothetical protein [Thermoleophilia bacterium]